METDLKNMGKYLNIIKGEMSEVSFNTWIKVVSLYHSSNTIKISVLMSSSRYIEKRYKDLVINSIYSACSKQYNVEFLTESEIRS